MGSSLIVVTDIFGTTIWHQTLAKELASLGIKVNLISPYQCMMDFESEQDAYNAFLSVGGLPSLIDKVRPYISNSADNDRIVGFSAGAAAIWTLLENKCCEHVLLFYPGQIRHSLSIKPKMKPLIVFPKRESHFDLQSVIDILTAKNSANIIASPYLHGFVNPQSQCYVEVVSDKVFQFLQQWHKIEMKDAQKALREMFDLK